MGVAVATPPKYSTLRLQASGFRLQRSGYVHSHTTGHKVPRHTSLTNSATRLALLHECLVHGSVEAAPGKDRCVTRQNKNDVFHKPLGEFQLWNGSWASLGSQSHWSLVAPGFKIMGLLTIVPADWSLKAPLNAVYCTSSTQSNDCQLPTN